MAIPARIENDLTELKNLAEGLRVHMGSNPLVPAIFKCIGRLEKNIANVPLPPG